MQNAARPAVPTLRVSEQCRVVLDNDWSGDPDGLVGPRPPPAVTGQPGRRGDQLLPEPPVPRPVAPGGGRRRARRASCSPWWVATELPVHAGSEELFGGRERVRGGRRDRRRGPPGRRPAAVRCLRRTAHQRRPGAAPGTGHRGRLTLVWIGGSLDRGAFEYNRDTDPDAAAFVLAQADLDVQSFPVETYRRCAYSVAELEHDLGTTGSSGAGCGSTSPTRRTGSARRQLAARRQPAGAGHGAHRGVQPVDQQRRQGGRGERRVYTDVDTRLLFGDLLARLRAHEANR